jgi:hypothetical protein
MITLKRKNIELIILTIIGIVVYTFVFLNLNIDVSNEIAFSTVDSKSYLDVANWLENGVDSDQVSKRPVLYPIILLVSTKIGGVYGIWIFQVIFWLFSLNFIFLTIQQLTKSSITAYIGALVFMLNLSVIALTLHALTEVTTIFLLSMLGYFLTKKIKQYREPQFLHIGLFFLVLLTLVKPAFSLPLYFVFFIVFPLFYLKKHLKHPKHFIKLFLILLPLIIQLAIVKTKYDKLTVSTIGHTTFTNYFIAQGVENIESINREEALSKAMAFSDDEELDYVYEHLPVYTKLFWWNIFDNIDGKSMFLVHTKDRENYRFAEFMRVYNRLTVMVHYLFVLLTLPLLIMLLRKKNYPLLFILGFLYTLGLYFVVTTGISFWQGDRLTLPAIAIWSCLYPSIIYFYLKLRNPAKSVLKKEDIE